MCTCVRYTVRVYVRSGVTWVLLYLGSGSWERPSGNRRSRRSEACNYWSPRGPLWGRYGSSDVCCSCRNAQDFFFLTMRFKACVLSCVHLSSTHTAGLFLVWTAWDTTVPLAMGRSHGHTLRWHGSGLIGKNSKVGANMVENLQLQMSHHLNHLKW